MTKLTSVLLVVWFILVMAFPASASDTGLLELLEYTTVNDSGTNMLYFTTQSTITLDVPQYTRLRYIDMTFTMSDNTAPTAVAVRYNSAYTNLKIVTLGAGTYRAYGSLTAGYYDEVYVRFTAAGSQYMTLLSCKVSQISSNNFLADASVDFSDANGSMGTYDTGYLIAVNGFMETSASVPYQARIDVADWHKFDRLYVYGSVTDASINSIRVNVGTRSVNYTINFLDVEAGSYLNPEDLIGIGDIGSFGKYLYSIEVDLSDIPRTLTTSPLYVYVGGQYDAQYGMWFNCQYVSGGFDVADTTNVTWWGRFTAFMSSLFGGDTTDADNQQSTIESQVGELEQAGDVMADVTKPPVADLNMDATGQLDPVTLASVSTVFGIFFGSSIFGPVITMALILALVSYIIFGKSR